MTSIDRRAGHSERLDVDDEAMWSRARRPPLSAEALHRVAAHVKARQPTAVGMRSRWHVWVAASTLLLVGGVAGAGLATFVIKRPTPAVSDKEAQKTPGARPRINPLATPVLSAGSSASMAAVDEPLPAPAATPISGRHSGGVVQPGLREPAAGVAPPTPPPFVSPLVERPPSGPAAEVATLRAALAALNRERDPAAALSWLDRYDARFPTGVLRGEATLARARILRELGRDPELLNLLEHASLDGVARGAELRVLRGELRMTRGRFLEARDDFQAALVAGGPAAVQERALFGRASCSTSLGDEAGARADLRRFLDQFPASPRAADVREALAR
jgi:hypothetical protein